MNFSFIKIITFGISALVLSAAFFVKSIHTNGEVEQFDGLSYIGSQNEGNISKNLLTENSEKIIMNPDNLENGGAEVLDDTTSQGDRNDQKNSTEEDNSEDLVANPLPENPSNGEKSVEDLEVPPKEEIIKETGVPPPWEGFISDGRTVKWAEGVIGNSIFFGSEDAWLNCGNSSSTRLLGTSDMTISAWIKQDMNAPLYPKDIVFKGRPRERWWSMTLRGESKNGSILFQADDSKVSISGGGVSGFIDNTWHHIAIVFKYENHSKVDDYGIVQEIRNWIITSYFDGELDKSWEDYDLKFNSSDDLLGVFGSEYPLVLGKCVFKGDPFSGPCYNYDGYLDELYIFNRDLSEDEIFSLYSGATNNPPVISKEKIIGYWPFDENFGEVAHDLSGNENDCLLQRKGA
ncbi:MAG: hypothetical protein A3B96_01195 [Candidatus Spechtbacteria bacterium RIFCSPHIGHO2_02_FULL_43_15b]|uniref:LamG-like jellyroll fold domain-containing protein n=1 Tax=Candidatus Spechtbacteria bacterium RIFCSPHIGHO2_01_FULL_43_30 TaxID=1802158 RepID=A0A1G2H4D1_9BACT|nr:MAG: hypothetical protein A2827_03595 [Candidatus Spechtbacteria bacterium RIFCSPHIGHO2_01_FULL_43_30]OGZ59028.1 MAG: hypothetical protein A3B96_01195 [Candidatus Spechtbacteria bacterium RIFCSPHIGHO2_02_FULL_43_15b]